MSEPLQPEFVPGGSVGSTVDSHDDAVHGTAPARRLRRLFVTIPFGTACPQVGYAIIGYFSALQVQALTPAHKTVNLALVHATVAAVSVLAMPVIGVLSDRTRTRFGSRTPWMIPGILVASAGLAVTGFSNSIAMLLVAASIATVGLHVFATPLVAIQPDRVPVERRGRYSSLAALGRFLATALAPIIGAQFAFRIPLGYALIAVVIAVVAVGFVLFNPDTGNRDLPRPQFSASSLGRAYWVNPLKYPDFCWVFLGRFLITGAFFMVSTFQLYILEDYIGLDLHAAVSLTPMLALAILPGLILAIVVSGRLSDRLGRRKPVVLVGGLLIAASALIPMAAPTVPGMFGSFVLLGIGFGTFLAVDEALGTQALPSTADAGKDLGILHIAATLPNTVAPMIGALIVSTFGGYGALYPFVALVAGLGALAVLFVKKIR